MSRRLLEVRPEVELACAARARVRACREGGGTVRRGGEEGCLDDSSAETMDNQEAMVAAWGRRATTTLKVKSLLCLRSKAVNSRPNQYKL